MKILKKSMRAITWAVILVNVVVTVVIGGVLVVDVAMRHIAGHSLPASFDLTELAMVLITCTGLLWLDAERDHIGFTILVDKLKPGMQAVVETIWRLFAIALFSVLAWAGFRAAGDSARRNEVRMGLLELPVAPIRTVIAVSLVLLALLSLYYVIDAMVNRKVESLIERVESEDAVAD